MLGIVQFGWTYEQSFIKDPHKKYLAGERAPYTELYKKDSEAAK
ncbi:MAG: hypothetical protein ACTSO7_09710 [Candidatus Heimdallarchaeota archaeon]